jgi:hypothetical protein
MRRDGARIDKGVCITSHASQCRTVDQVVVLADGSDEKGWYVSLSRAREAMHVYTRNKAALRQSVMHPGERESVWELVHFSLGRTKKQLGGSLKISRSTAAKCLRFVGFQSFELICRGRNSDIQPLKPGITRNNIGWEQRGKTSCGSTCCRFRLKFWRRLDDVNSSEHRSTTVKHKMPRNPIGPKRGTPAEH